ncbi:MAG: outer membrane beta-barrel domain-containing protein [Desulfuromonadales bacterium]|nr:outer membrane beta-barrel domain-containing protein [Desulfuromonadales bacterium]
MKKFLSIAALAATVLCSSMAHAENRANSFVITPFIGGYHFDGAEQRGVNPNGTKFSKAMSPTMLFGIKAGYNITKTIGLEAGVQYIATELTNNKSPNNISKGGWQYRLEGLYNFMPDSWFVPYIAVGYGGQHLKEVNNASKNSGIFDYGLGAKFFVTDDIAIRADVRHLIRDMGPTSNNFEYTLGIGFFFGGHKPAPAPAAPTCALAANPTTIVSGSSSTLSWTSQNATSLSIQPSVGAVVANGSASVTPSTSTNYTLTCAGEGGSTTSNATVQVTTPAAPLAPVCNLSATPASIVKGDSSALNWSCQNATDCVIRPAVGAVEATSGTRNVAPTDTTDFTLICRGQGGVTNNTATVQVRAPKVMTKPEGEACETVTIKVLFDFDKYFIKPQFKGELKRAADAIARHPNSFTRIAGHTDNIGTFKYNMGLSQRRANAVRNYLIKNFNVNPKQLDAKGYSFSKPIATNKTAAGRALNRRVQAEIYCSPDEKK